MSKFNINKLMEDSKFVDFVVNKFIPFRAIYQMCEEEYHDFGNQYCLFHDHSHDTPSAKIFNDERGDSLWCFNENRRYKPSDAFRKEIIAHRIETVFYNILKQFNDMQIQALLDEYGSDLDIAPIFNEEQVALLSRFKEGKDSIVDFNKNLINALFKA